MLYIAVHRSIGVGDRGWGLQLSQRWRNLQKINHNQAENRPKVLQNFCKQQIFHWAAPPKFYLPLRPWGSAMSFLPSNSAGPTPTIISDIGNNEACWKWTEKYRELTYYDTKHINIDPEGAIPIFSCSVMLLQRLEKCTLNADLYLRDTKPIRGKFPWNNTPSDVK